MTAHHEVTAALFGVACLALGGACRSVFACEGPSGCYLDGEQGQCEASGFCSFPDGDCPSGHRYGEFAPSQLADDCVPVESDTSTSSSGVDSFESGAAEITGLESGVEDTSTTAADSSGDSTDGGGDYSCPDTYPCTLFVSPVGDDNLNDGSDSEPFRTIQRAVMAAGPGSVICAHEGDYEEHVEIDHSGEPGAPIVLRSHPGETAHLLSGMKIMAGWGVAVGHVVLEGLDITQNGPTNPEVGDQCIWLHSAHDVLIRNNYVHACNGSGVGGTARDLVVDSNQISRCALDAVDVSTAGAMSVSGTNIVVQNNRIDRHAGNGVVLAANPWDETDPNHAVDASYNGAAGWLVTNNVFAFNQNRGGVLVWQADAVDATIQNNIFVGNAQDGPQSSGPNGIAFYYSGGGHVVRHNLYFGTALPVEDTAEGASYTESDAIEADPLLVDPDGTEFRLFEDSPAIDAGILEGAPAIDTECTPRPQGAGVDLGPYEALP